MKVFFALYLNDFGEFLQKSYKGLGNLCSEINNCLSQDGMECYIDLFALMYADDTIVLGESPQELQKALNSLYDYCRLWRLRLRSCLFCEGRISVLKR